MRHGVSEAAGSKKKEYGKPMFLSNIFNGYS